LGGYWLKLNANKATPKDKLDEIQNYVTVFEKVVVIIHYTKQANIKARSF